MNRETSEFVGKQEKTCVALKAGGAAPEHAAPCAHARALQVGSCHRGSLWSSGCNLPGWEPILPAGDTRLVPPERALLGEFQGTWGSLGRGLPGSKLAVGAFV